MKRTRFPQKTKNAIQKIPPDEMMEDLNNGEKARMIAIQTEIQIRLINIKKDIYQIGKQLFEAKTTLPHGMFTPWIDHFFGKELPYSTANFYMKVYNVFKDHPKTIQYIPSQYLLMITSSKFPNEIVKLMNENPEKINKQGLEQINEVYELYKDGSIGSNKFLKLAEKQIELGLDIWKGRAEHRLNANMRLSFEWGAGDILKRIQALRHKARDLAGLYPHDPDSPEHKKLISDIDITIKELEELKIDLEDTRGFFKRISTENGTKHISNL
jgi:hypothetical protein